MVLSISSLKQGKYILANTTVQRDKREISKQLPGLNLLFVEYGISQSIVFHCTAHIDQLKAWAIPLI